MTDCALAAPEQIDPLVAALRAEEAERARLRTEYEVIGIGSTDHAFAEAVTAYAAADVRCCRLEEEIKQLRAEADRAPRKGAV